METVNFIALSAIKKDFDSTMDKVGYCRTSAKCKEWGITNEQLSRYIKKGYTADIFVVCGVRYINKDAVSPLEVQNGKQ